MNDPGSLVGDIDLYEKDDMSLNPVSEIFANLNFWLI